MDSDSQDKQVVELMKKFVELLGKMNKTTVIQTSELIKSIDVTKGMTKVAVEVTKQERAKSRTAKNQSIQDEKKYVQTERQLDIRLKEMQAALQNRKLQIHINRLRQIERLQLEETHKLGVRGNIILRNSNKSLKSTMAFFTNSLRGGFGFQAGIGSLIGGMAQTTKRFGEVSDIIDEIKNKETAKVQVTQEIEDTKLGHGIGQMGTTMDKEEQEAANDEFVAKIEELKASLSQIDSTLKSLKSNEKDLEKANPITKNPILRGLFDKMGKMGKMFSKHSLPIMLGVGVGGIIMSVIIKAFSASPLFQQMMKLLKFSVSLILMPIGTFFGAIMRPILIMLLRKFIVPFYSTFMPKWMIWGGEIGGMITELLAWLGGDGSKSTEQELIDNGVLRVNPETGVPEYQSLSDRLYNDIMDIFLPQAGAVIPNDGDTERTTKDILDEDYGGIAKGDHKADAMAAAIADASGGWGDEKGLPPYINPITAGASTPLSPAQRDSQLMMSNPTLWNQQNTFEKYRETGGIIEEVVSKVKEVIINPLTNLPSKIINAGISEKPIDTNAEWRKNNPNAGGINPANYSQATLDILAAQQAWKDGGSNNIIGAAGGFDGFVTKPTMFMTGESGTEHVTVTPSGKQSGGGIVINIQNMNGSDDDMRKLKKTILEVIQESTSNRGRI